MENEYNDINIHESFDLMLSLAESLQESKKSSDEENTELRKRAVYTPYRSIQKKFTNSKLYMPIINWFDKPTLLSPTECARYGWINIDTDCLECEYCGERLLVNTSEDVDIDRSLLKQYFEALTTTHTSLCPWRESPCEETIYTFPLLSSNEIIREFQSRLLNLIKLGDKIPVVKANLNEEFMETMDSVVPPEEIGALQENNYEQKDLSLQVLACKNVDDIWNLLQSNSEQFDCEYEHYWYCIWVTGGNQQLRKKDPKELERLRPGWNITLSHILEHNLCKNLTNINSIACKNFVIPIFNQKRFAHDVVVRQKTGRTIIKYGHSGRSSVSGHIATVFGCTGFIGRYVVSKLVVIPYRDENDKRFLKVTGDLGQIVPLEFDLRNKETISEAVRHSDIVYNLIGRDYETKNFSYEKVNVQGAAIIAEVCREEGVDRLVHVSALNADINSQSEFFKTKALGENAVREIFPDVTIVRPSIVFGYEDRFLNRMGVLDKFELTVNKGKTRFRPVNVLDVAHALELMLKDESTIGQTYELFGPTEYTMNQLYDIADEILITRRTRINVPKPLAIAITNLLRLSPWPFISPDEIVRYFIDEKISNSKDVKTFEDLGVIPYTLEDTAIATLRDHRKSAVFDQPVTPTLSSDRSTLLREKKYFY
nr:2574_t:CDS:10 [Entrophospora candida]